MWIDGRRVPTTTWPWPGAEGVRGPRPGLGYALSKPQGLCAITWKGAVSSATRWCPRCDITYLEMGQKRHVETIVSVSAGGCDAGHFIDIGTSGIGTTTGR